MDYKIDRFQEQFKNYKGEKDLRLRFKGGAMKPKTLRDEALIYIFSRNDYNGGL
jgi:hypothetical protein